jgi:hypothetical protein
MSGALNKTYENLHDFLKTFTPALRRLGLQSRTATPQGVGTSGSLRSQRRDKSKEGE